MISCCRYLIKSAFHSEQCHRCFSIKFNPCWNRRIHKTICNYYGPESDVINWKNKLKKLEMKYQNDKSLSLPSLNRILAHPCFDSHISKEDALLLLKSVELINDELPVTRVAYIWKIWEYLKKFNFVDLDSFHCLLTTLQTTRLPVDVNHLLTCLQTDDFSPTTETYNLLLRCVSENNNFDDVQSLVSLMTREGHTIDDETQKAVVYATAKCRGISCAIDYVQNSTKEMNANLYVSLLRSTAENSNADLFNQLFNEALEKELKFSSHQRLPIIESLINGNLTYLIINVLGDSQNWRSNLILLCNLCVRCMYDRKYEAIYIILNKIEEYLNDPMPSIYEQALTYGEFLVTQMVKSKMPLDDILRFCGKNTDLLKNATYASLRHRVFEYSLDLFKTMKQNGLPIRPHFFWPLFVSSNNDKEIFGVLSEMNALEVQPDYETLFQYVYPRINVNSPITVLENLQYGATNRDSTTAMVAYLLINYRLSEAVDLCQLGTEVNYNILYPKMSLALHETEDFESIVKICQNSKSRLMKLFRVLLRNYKNKIQPKLVKKFLNIFAQSDTIMLKLDLEILREYLKEHNFEETVSNNTSNNELHLRPHLRDMNIEELEAHLAYLKKNNSSSRQALRRLLIMHAEFGNTDRALELKKEVEDNNYPFSSGMMSVLIKSYCRKNDFDAAYNIFLELKKSGKENEIQARNILHLASLAVKRTDLEVVYEILKSENRPNDCSKQCVYLLKNITERFGFEEADRMFRYLIYKKYCQVNASLLGPLIKDHLLRQDVEKAALACLQYGNRYGILPRRSVVLCALAALAVEEQVQKKADGKYSKLLNQLLQMSCYLYGQHFTNITYVITLAEMGLLATLRSFSTESLTGTDEKIMWHECNKLADRNELQTLINLETVFKEISHFDLEPIYINLMKIYYRNKDLLSAQKLLKSMESSNRVPSVTFLDMYTKLQNGDEKT